MARTFGLTNSHDEPQAKTEVRLDIKRGAVTVGVAWPEKALGSNAAATEAAAERVATIAQAFPTHEDIQHESAVAWRLLAWAHKDSNTAATEAAAERVATIAQAFPSHGDIQHESAQAWRYLAKSAVKHNDEARVSLAMTRLDALCHEHRAGPQVTWHPGAAHPGVLAERELARATVQRWRERRDPDPDAATA